MKRSDQGPMSTIPAVKSLSLRAKAAQCVFPSLRDSEQVDPSRQSPSGQSPFGPSLGGFVLFGGLAERLPGFLERLSARHSPRPLIASDLERGAGQQVAGATVLPSLMAIGATGSEELARRAGEHTGLEAQALGIDVVYAPVVDVNTRPGNPIIDVRAFGDDPVEVARLGAAFIRGLESTGVLACAKHFPGHGDTDVDSHLDLPVINSPAARYEQVDLPPFAAAVRAGVSSVMTAHIAVPALDPSGVPATLSAPILQGLLRKRLGFEGLIFSDALIMAGLAKHWPETESAVLSLAAGCDVVICMEDPVAVVNAIARAVEQGRLSEARLNEAVGRIFRAKERRVLARAATQAAIPVASTVGAWAELRARGEALAAEIAQAAVTRLIGSPLSVAPAGVGVMRPVGLALCEDSLTDAEAFLAEFQGRGLSVAALCPDGLTGGPASSETILSGPGPVVVGVFSKVRAWKGGVGLSASLARALERLGPRAQAISFASPYLAGKHRTPGSWLLAYDDSPAAVRAAVAAALGERLAPGRLPVKLP